MPDDLRNPLSWAAAWPDRPAVIMGGSGETVTYAELADRISRLVRLLRSFGLSPGDVVALLSENSPRYHEVVWACRLGGFYFVTLNVHLTPGEIEFLLADSGASVLIASARQPAAASIEAPGVSRRLAQFGPIAGFDSYEEALAGQPPTPPVPGVEGDILQYSSGTTGRPKGIKRPLRDTPAPFDGEPVVTFLKFLGFPDGGCYLSPAPLYHTAPILWTMALMRFGGTAVVMERFDPLETLRLIEKYRITHGQFVPTMFVRMLKLPESQRAGFDVSSLVTVVHAAAPCPIEIKRAMIDWWGPKISEFWSSSEGAGGTFITAAEWLEHPGSVGRPMLGSLHILDGSGAELPPGEQGVIWAEGTPPFSYHNDPAKDRETTSPRGWRSVGDIGRLDGDGYLYLTDRSAFVVISGGVNIYPQEAENLLIEHPRVMDAAVFGIPHPEWGEQVWAVVQPVDAADAGPGLAADLDAWCRASLAAYKCPRGFDFDPALPRMDNGKLMKRLLADRYRAAAPALPHQ